MRRRWHWHNLLRTRYHKPCPTEEPFLDAVLQDDDLRRVAERASVKIWVWKRPELYRSLSEAA
jgi:hypothetical protein